MAIHPSVTTATIKEFSRRRVVSYLEHQPLLGLLDQKGRISTGHSGLSYDWNVAVGRNPGTSVEDFQDLQSKIVRRNHEIRCNLDWAEYASGEAASAGEFARQGEDTTISNLKQHRIPGMLDAMLDDNLMDDILNSDDPTDNSIVGLESIFGYTAGSTDTVVANDTYAGYSTAPNGLTGVDGAESDAWSPSLVNQGSTNFSSWSNTTARKITQFAIAKTVKGTRADQKPDFGLFNQDEWITLKDQVGNQERIMVGANNTDTAWGLGGDLYYIPIDGVKIFWDSKVASGAKYILNSDQLELMFLRIPNVDPNVKEPHNKSHAKKDWFDVAVSYDGNRRALAITATMRCQLKICSPRFHTKIADFSS